MKVHDVEVSLVQQSGDAVRIRHRSAKLLREERRQQAHTAAEPNYLDAFVVGDCSRLRTAMEGVKSVHVVDDRDAVSAADQGPGEPLDADGVAVLKQPAVAES